MAEHGRVKQGAGPTGHAPGTRGKIAVMALRASLGLPLFHPLDADGEGVLAAVRRCGKSLPKGVAWYGKRRKYRARVWDGSKRRAVHLGMFATPAEARGA